MRIEWTPPLSRAKGRRDDRGDGAAGSSFSVPLSGEASVQAPTVPAAQLGSVDGLLAVQEMPDALAGRRRAAQRGEMLLDRLDELRIGLVAGAVPRDRLDELGRLAKAARGQVDDPRLNAILDDIELRVAVELAKLDIAL